MGWRSLPIGRLVASAAVFGVAGASTGCDSDRAYEQAIGEAESGVAISLEITAAHTADLLSARGSLNEVSEEDITAAFLNDLRQYTGASPGPADKRAVFDIVENPDGTVAFSVFLGSSANASGGLVVTNQSRHSCGTLAGRFSSPAVVVGDLDCPPDIEALAGEDSIAVSMTENAAKYGAEIGTSS